ncbi:MAG: STAS domain-containing protein, partial [Anaerolineales bacterium]
SDQLSELNHKADPPLHTVVIDFEGVNFIDSQGVDKVSEILDWAARHDIELRLARVKTKVKEYLNRDSVIAKLGEGQIYGNIYEAAADLISDTSTTQTELD